MAKTLSEIVARKPPFIRATDPIGGSVAPEIEDALLAEDGTIINGITGADNKFSAHLWGKIKLLVELLQKEFNDDAWLKRIDQSLLQTDSPVFQDVSVGETLSVLSHLLSTLNPHGVTKAQVGLGNVDNIQQIPLSQRAQPNGVATLDAAGNVEQLPVLDTDTVTEAGNLYYTEARVSANTDVAANTAKRIILNVVTSFLNEISDTPSDTAIVSEGAISRELAEMDSALRLWVSEQQSANAGRAFFPKAQPGHNLVPGNAVAFDGSDLVKIRATETDYRESCGIVETVDGDTITVVFAGTINIDSASWTPGEIYVLSDTVPGGLQVTDVGIGSIQKPMLLAMTATLGLVLPFRGVLKTDDPFDLMTGHTHNGIDSSYIPVSSISAIENYFLSDKELPLIVEGVTLEVTQESKIISVDGAKVYTVPAQSLSISKSDLVFGENKVWVGLDNSSQVTVAVGQDTLPSALVEGRKLNSFFVSAAGDIPKQDSVKKTIESYQNLLKDSFTVVGNLLTATAASHVIRKGEYVYLISGTESQDIQQASILDLSSWSSVGTTPILQYAGSLFIGTDDYVYIVSGDTVNITRAPLTDLTNWTVVGALSEPRSYSMSWSDGEYAYIFGGFNGSTCVSSILRASLSNLTNWVDTGTTLPNIWARGALSQKGRDLYIVGGTNDNSNSIENAYHSQISNPLSWMRLVTPQIQNYPSRSFQLATTVNTPYDVAYFGGYTTVTTAYAYVAYPYPDQIQRYNATLPAARLAMSPYFYNGEIYLMAGSETTVENTIIRGTLEKKTSRFEIRDGEFFLEGREVSKWELNINPPWMETF